VTKIVACHAKPRFDPVPVKAKAEQEFAVSTQRCIAVDAVAGQGCSASKLFKRLKMPLADRNRPLEVR
jgi:hypothetical protein